MSDAATDVNKSLGAGGSRVTGVLDLLEHLARVNAAVSAAQQALHRLVELGITDASQGHAGARTRAPVITRPAPAKRVQAILRAREPSACAVCGGAVTQPQCGARRIYCGVRCIRAARAGRRAEREAAADRATAAAIVEQNATEGYPNLQYGSNGHA
jgi:hypothetical protein